MGLLLAGGVAGGVALGIALGIALALCAEGEQASGIVVQHPVAAFGLRLFLAALRRCHFRVKAQVAEEELASGLVVDHPAASLASALAAFCRCRCRLAAWRFRHRSRSRAQAGLQVSVWGATIWRGSAISSEHMVQAAIRPSLPVVVNMGVAAHALRRQGLSPSNCTTWAAPPQERVSHQLKLSNIYIYNIGVFLSLHTSVSDRYVRVGWGAKWPTN